MVPAHSFTVQVSSGSKEHCLDGAWRIKRNISDSVAGAKTAMQGTGSGA